MTKEPESERQTVGSQCRAGIPSQSLPLCRCDRISIMMWLLVAASFVLIGECAGLGLPLPLPADVAITGGRAVNSVCGACCQANTFCGTVLADLHLHDTDGNSLRVPKGSNMTCLLRSRNVFGAVDSGLCVPSDLPANFGVADMCRLHDKTLPASHTLDNRRVVYQSGLVSQEKCGVCYDGYHFCDSGTVCRRTSVDTSAPDSPRAICVPTSETTSDACGYQLIMDEQLRHESCDRPTPAAEVFEQQHSLPFRRRLQAVGDTASRSSRKLLQADQHTTRNLLSSPTSASPAAVTAALPSKAVSSPAIVSLSKSIPSPTPLQGANSAPAPAAAASNATPMPSKATPATTNHTPTPTAKPKGHSPAPAPKITPAATPKLTADPKHTPTPTPKRTPAPTPKTTPRWTPHAFAPSGGGGQAGWCNKNLDCALPQYNMCQKGKCVKKPNYCENNKHCKAGYECMKHFCAKKQASAPSPSPKQASKSSPAKQ